MPEDSGPKKSGWKKVTRNFQSIGSARRGTAAFIVRRTGLTEGNVEATQWLDKIAVLRGIEPKDYLLQTLVDEERELIAIYPIPKGVPGAVTITRYENGASSRISFHLGGAFAEAPSLRPEGKKVQCLMSEELDEEGLPVILIPTKTGKAKATRSRGGSSTPGSQAAAGQTGNDETDNDEDLDI